MMIFFKGINILRLILFESVGLGVLSRFCVYISHSSWLINCHQLLYFGSIVCCVFILGLFCFVVSFGCGVIVCVCFSVAADLSFFSLLVSLFFLSLLFLVVICACVGFVFLLFCIFFNRSIF